MFLVYNEQTGSRRLRLTADDYLAHYFVGSSSGTKTCQLQTGEFPEGSHKAYFNGLLLPFLHVL